MLQLLSPGPASSEAEHGPPAGTHRAHVRTAHVQTHAAGHADNVHSTHTNTSSTSGLILLPALAEQNGRPLVRMYIYISIDVYIYTYRYIYACTERERTRGM